MTNGAVSGWRTGRIDVERRSVTLTQPNTPVGDFSFTVNNVIQSPSFSRAGDSGSVVYVVQASPTRTSIIAVAGIIVGGSATHSFVSRADHIRNIWAWAGVSVELR